MIGVYVHTKVISSRLVATHFIAALVHVTLSVLLIVMREVTVEGYDAIRKELTSLSGKVFVLFTGSKIDGKSWCPDCVAAEPVIDSILHSSDGKSLDATFVTCYVGAREYWKDPACPFRTDKDFKLTCVPTLIEVGKKHKRLLDSQAKNASLVKDFFFEDN
ncbi:hypothetical protein ANCCAN_09841 [Ancylostoma caninum]|uniref:Thioredoxin domain-containing protein 17 n=1 Tax=Ancylostoma caninum TaxID=29170 RepID=A0A368GIF5_ANCCA|nr:hypothetical protein ANCCAN_09841 [Ancylostoma caninum]